MTSDTATDDRLTAALRLGTALVDAWGSWSPTMTPDARRVAFISDRSGTPEVWVQEVVLQGEAPPPTRIPLSADPVIDVSWSADSRWLACAVATGGGVRTQVWVVRPDGQEARRIAGDVDEHAELGPWTRSGHRLVVTYPSPGPGRPTTSFLADPRTGRMDPLASGELLHVLDISLEERFLILIDGERGRRFCTVVDRLEDEHFPLLPAGTGSTDTAIVRPAPEGESGPLYAYLASDVGLSRRQLIGVPFGPNGHRAEPRTLAFRDDAELEAVDADDEGQLLLLVWNAAGRSELELFHTGSHQRVPITGLPGLVATTPVLSRDGGSVILGVEGPERPRELWHLDTHSRRWTRVTAAPHPEGPLVTPTLERFAGQDGLPLTGWLYRAPAAEPGPAVVYLHGGPEAQERPTFSPHHQALASAGISVFAVNIRGSSGFGREFVHADDLGGRFDAFADVTAAAHHLVATGAADRRRIGVTGRSYGGYLTLTSLAFSPGVFAAGADVCGMSDLTTFYAETEPWIGAAAVTKYGHPERDRALLDAISPLASADAIDVPLLVVHGELDTNVPVGESRRVVQALESLDRPVEYLELPGEGHEYRRADSKRRLLTALVRFFVAHLG